MAAMERALVRFDFLADSSAAIRRPPVTRRPALHKRSLHKPLDRQYLHRSGCAFVRARGRTFLFMVNRIHTPFMSFGDKAHIDCNDLLSR